MTSQETLQAWEGSNGTIVLSKSINLPDYPNERFGVVTIDTLGERITDAILRLQNDESTMRHHLIEQVDHETDPCRWDHNQNCQEHGSFNYDGTCHLATARKALGYA